MKRVLIPLAPGFEEIEALAVVDILRRASIEVVMAGTVEGPITGRNLITVLPDAVVGDLLSRDFDMIMLPGGKEGTENLKADERVLKLVREFSESKRFVTAICAAPTVLKAAGVIKGKRLTSHPSVRNEFDRALFSEERVVTDGTLVTSQGPGTAIEFAYRLLELLVDSKKVVEVNNGVLANI